jgi:electron transport complex protein RnfC
MRYYTFPRGGFVYKDPTTPDKNTSEVVTANLPALSIIPLGNHAGNAYPLVTVGDTVREGMLIGRAAEHGTVNVHATVPGKIIRKITWSDAYENEIDAYAIKMEGHFDKLGRREEIFPWAGLNCYDLQKIISDFGVVEMDNTGRPLADMISSYRKDNSSITLVVRCVFDDPWLAADYALCHDRCLAVAEGAAIVARACSKVDKIIYAVSYHEKKLGEKLLAEAANYDIPAFLVLTGFRYPQRNSRELKIALRLYEKKEGLKRSSFLILGPASLVAAYDAVKYKKPVLDRYIVVGGSAVKHPKIMKVRIGTRIGELIEQCGGFIEKPEHIATGSPLLGKKVKYLDEPVLKTCYAVAAMSKSQASLYKVQNCINCGECRAVCPIGLDPQYLYKQIRMFGYNKSLKYECHGCGCCKTVCPSSIPLSDVILGVKLPEAHSG